MVIVELTTVYLPHMFAWNCFTLYEDNSNIYLISLSLCHNQVGHKYSIELFCTLDLSAYHQEISKCFESAAFEAVDHLLKVSHCSLSLLNFESLRNNESIGYVIRTDKPFHNDRKVILVVWDALWWPLPLCRCGCCREVEIGVYVLSAGTKNSGRCIEVAVVGI